MGSGDSQAAWSKPFIKNGGGERKLVGFWRQESKASRRRELHVKSSFGAYREKVASSSTLVAMVSFEKLSVLRLRGRIPIIWKLLMKEKEKKLGTGGS